MSDKRRIFTDALRTLGTVINKHQQRDVIHLSVEPVFAKEHLVAGDHVTFDGRKESPYSSKAVGIVDPFLPRPGVKIGERFWLVRYPFTLAMKRLKRVNDDIFTLKGSQ